MLKLLIFSTSCNLVQAYCHSVVLCGGQSSGSLRGLIPSCDDFEVMTFLFISVNILRLWLKLFGRCTGETVSSDCGGTLPGDFDFTRSAKTQDT